MLLARSERRPRVPTSHVYPLWLRNLAPSMWQWVQVPGTDLSVAAGGAGGNGALIVKAFGGNGKDIRNSEIHSACASGHADGGQNGWYSCILEVDVPGWAQRIAPSGTYVADSGGRNPDGTPAGRHLYSSSQFDALRNRLMLVGAVATYGNGSGTSTEILGCNTANNTYDALAALYPVLPFNPDHQDCCAQNDVTGDIVYQNVTRNGDDICVWRAATNTIDNYAGNPLVDFGAIAVDSRRDQFFYGQAGGVGPHTHPMSDVSSDTFTARTLTGAMSALPFGNGYSGMEFIDMPDAADDFYLHYMGAAGGAVIRINASSWVTDTPTVSGAIPETLNDGGGSPKPCNNFHFMPNLDGVVTVPTYGNAGGDVWYMKVRERP
jgi:hypothetical protein